MSERYLRPNWPAPASVRACVTTRNGGFSASPFDSFNLGLNTGDDLHVIQTNRRLVCSDLKLDRPPLWLQQVHGALVVEAESAADETRADASFARTPGRACAVLTADCLGVLFCDVQGTVVGAAHAGWKGLLGGVLEATVQRMGGDNMMAWLGPAISQRHFEIGPEVRAQFLAHDSGCSGAFVHGQGDRWFANLQALARRRLNALGVDVYHCSHCSFAEPSLFYSYRRDGASSGRMASLIWLEG